MILVGEETDGSPEGSRSPTPSEDHEEVLGPPKRINSSPQVSSFVDLSVWKRYLFYMKHFIKNFFFVMFNFLLAVIGRKFAVGQYLLVQMER